MDYFLPDFSQIFVVPGILFVISGSINLAALFIRDATKQNPVQMVPGRRFIDDNLGRYSFLTFAINVLAISHLSDLRFTYRFAVLATKWKMGSII